MDRRGARAEDFVACLKAVWGPDPVEHHGEFYAVPRSRVDPKPVQSPHPPLLMGGGADAALRRIGRIADGWISSSRTDLTTIGTSVDVVKAAAVEAGRDPEALRFVVRGVVRLTDDRTAGEARIPLQGTADQIRDDLHGADRCTASPRCSSTSTGTTPSSARGSRRRARERRTRPHRARARADSLRPPA